MKKVIYAACLLSGIFLASCTKPEDDQLNKIDLTFIMQANISNSAEIGAGALAATKATNPEVKKFAMMMVEQHSMAQSDLRNLGSNVGVEVKDSLDPIHVSLKDLLTSLPAGRAFDSVYINSQVPDHDLSIANFLMEKASGSHRDVIDYADRYFPHITMHRQSADSIASAFFRR